MKTYKIKLITSDPNLPRWRSLDDKIREVEDELNTILSGKFVIIPEYKPLIPDVQNGRITHDWMDSISGPEYRKGYDFVSYHMSVEQKNKFKIGRDHLGLYFNDLDYVHESYFWCDEDTLRGDKNQFVQTFLHEIRHGLLIGMGLYDDTHIQHADGEIKGSFYYLSMLDYLPQRRIISTKLTIISIAKELINLFKMKMSKENTLYQACLKFIGKDASPKDLAPDYLGCAETVSNIIRQVVPDFPLITGTWTLWDKLEKDPSFKRVTIPMPGTIIICPTDGTKAIPGHAGFYGKGDTIMSNDSYTGTFEENFTRDTWNKRYQAAGYTSYLYQLIK